MSDWELEEQARKDWDRECVEKCPNPEHTESSVAAERACPYCRTHSFVRWQVNAIVSHQTGMAHVVGDVSEDDVVETDPYKMYAGWSDCGISVDGKLHRRAERITFQKMCKRCFKPNRRI